MGVWQIEPKMVSKCPHLLVVMPLFNPFILSLARIYNLLLTNGI